MSYHQGAYVVPPVRHRNTKVVRHKRLRPPLLRWSSALVHCILSAMWISISIAYCPPIASISSSIDSRNPAGHCLSTTEGQKLEERTLNSCFAHRFVCSLSSSIFLVMVYTADGATCFLPLMLVFCANLAWGLNRYDTGTGTTTATLPYIITYIFSNTKHDCPSWNPSGAAMFTRHSMTRNTIDSIDLN